MSPIIRFPGWNSQLGHRSLTQGHSFLRLPLIMRRKSKKKANNLAAYALLVAMAALVAGFYIEYRLRPYRILAPFTSTERGWRDNAFELALYSGLIALAVLLLAHVLRK